MPPSNLRKNIAALYVVQIASYLTPLFTLPWLTRVLGPSGFGELSFCVAVTGYFVLLADYGFNLSATRQIAVCRDDRHLRSVVFWNTMAVKAILGSIGLPLLMALTGLVTRFGEERSLLLINYLTVLGSVLTPTWYFMGCERQVVLSSITVATRLLAVPATFVLVRSAGDLQAAALIPAGLTVVGGLISLGFLIATRQVGFTGVHLSGINAAFRDGLHLFLSTAATSLYQATNTVLLGIFSGSVAVGHFSAAEKIIQACQSLITPISQSIYPRVSRLMHDSQSEAFVLVRKVLKVQGSAACLLSLGLFAFAPLIVRVLFGAQYAETITVLRWLAVVPLLVALSNVFGVQTMLAMGMNKQVARILVCAGALNVLLLCGLASWLGALGAAASVVTTELFVTCAMAVFLIRRKLPVFRIGLAV
jgi:O-antigen/teichoic acid export membrane protein